MCVRAAWFTVRTVVRTHHRCVTRCRDGGAKGRQVRLSEFAFGCRCVEAVTFGLRARVNGVVFRSRDDFQILWIIALESFYEFDSESSSQVRVFAVSLLPASPARVAKNVDVRRPESETVKPIVVTTSLRLVVLRTSFFRDHGRDAAHKFGVNS